jgi:hypothetical protein
VSREIFQARKFGADKLAEIDQANRIIDEYRAAGFRLTLRQLYYQHVARDLIPNTLKEYNYLGWIMTLARDAGLPNRRAYVL